LNPAISEINGLLRSGFFGKFIPKPKSWVNKPLKIASANNFAIFLRLVRHILYPLYLEVPQIHKTISVIKSSFTKDMLALNTVLLNFRINNGLQAQFLAISQKNPVSYFCAYSRFP